jgi:hypothetical protein
MALSVAKEVEVLSCSPEKIQKVVDKLDKILELVEEDELRPQALTCPKQKNPYPELASLGEYMKQRNLTTIYGIKTNTQFLSNILWGWVPENSSAWHPQNLSQWAEAQIGEAYFGILFALVIRCFDSILAALAARGMKIRPTWLGKVK